MEVVISLQIYLFGHSTGNYFDSEFHLGLFSHINYNIHSADFRKIPDCPSCSPGYESGSGLGPSFGLMFDYKISDNLFAGANLTYLNYSALLSRIEETKIIVIVKKFYFHRIVSYFSKI